MRTVLARLFAESPFARIGEHMDKVQACVDVVPKMIDALFEENFEELEQLAKQVYKLEHEADIVKGEIRDHLPKSIFLPVDRADLLMYLKEQDAIADAVEDLAVVLTIRKLHVPEELRPDLRHLVNRSVDACREAGRLVGEIGTLLVSGFKGSEVDEVIGKIAHLGVIEWETDKQQQKLVKKLFQIEPEPDPINVFFMMKVFEEIDGLADHAENLGDIIRMMISKG
ncbi:MAG: TIGR00153 family protein [Calditrichaeota bacterium]|nr:TIGR00153 family protein [Calditrichota bacterium]